MGNESVDRFADVVQAELKAGAAVLAVRQEYMATKATTDAQLHDRWQAMQQAVCAYETVWQEARLQIAALEARLLEAQFALDDARSASRRAFYTAQRALREKDETP